MGLTTGVSGGFGVSDFAKGSDFAKWSDKPDELSLKSIKPPNTGFIPIGRKNDKEGRKRPCSSSDFGRQCPCDVGLQCPCDVGRQRPGDVGLQCPCVVGRQRACSSSDF